MVTAPTLLANPQPLGYSLFTAELVDPRSPGHAIASNTVNSYCRPARRPAKTEYASFTRLASAWACCTWAGALPDNLSGCDLITSFCRLSSICSQGSVGNTRRIRHASSSDICGSGNGAELGAENEVGAATGGPIGCSRGACTDIGAAAPVEAVARAGMAGCLGGITGSSA